MKEITLVKGPILIRLVQDYADWLKRIVALVIERME